MIANINLRRSNRVHRLAISNDYLIYLYEYEFEVNEDLDPLTFSQVVSNCDSLEWIITMEDELVSMDKKQVWDLVKLLVGCVLVGCKWVFKTKRCLGLNWEV